MPTDSFEEANIAATGIMANSSSFLVSGGTVNVSGILESVTLENTGGRVDLLNGSTADVDYFRNRSGGVTNLMAGGTLTINNSFGVSGGIVNLREDLQTPALAGGFEFGGGEINLLDSKTLTVNATGSDLTLGGSLNFQSGTAGFNDNISFHGGGLFNKTANDATLSMNGYGVEIRGAGTLDASVGNLIVDNTSGLSISGGTYRAGWNTGTNSINWAEVNTGGIGELTVTASSTITMTNSLQARAQDAANRGDTLLILKSDAILGASAKMSWEDAGFIYDYELAQVGGVWGLYVTGYRQLSDEEKLNRLLQAWNKHIKVRGHADNLIRSDYVDAIFAGRQMQVSLDYDNLSTAGKFNADTLASLMTPGDNVGYDALMLYNGSGLALANQATLAITGQLIDRLGQRNAQVRREMSESGATYGCGSTLASEFMNRDLGNRLWVTGSYHGDKQSWDEGFAGYEYRSRGVMLGYDRIFGCLVLGGAFSYSSGDFEDLAALDNNSTLDTYGMYLYGSYNHPSGFFLSAAGGYATTDNQISDMRVLNEIEGWNRADYDTSTWMVSAAAGYDFWLTDTLSLTPSIGFSHQTAEAEAHEQYFASTGFTNVGAATLRAGEVKNHSSRMPLKMRVGYDAVSSGESLLSLNADFGYAYEFNHKGADGEVTYAGLDGIGPVRIVSHGPGRHIYNVGIGAKYMYKQFEFAASYDFSWREQFRTHQVFGGVAINF